MGRTILKMKSGGLNAISTYIFWNLIEPANGEFDFSGNNAVREVGEPWIISLRRFKQQLTGAGLHLRIEPKLTKNEGNDDQDTMLLDSKQVESGEDCRLRSIHLVPQYATKVTF